MLNKKESAALLQIAREAICHCVHRKAYSPDPREEKSLTQRSGCFVTIKQDGQLRGCIGNFKSHRPLYQEVAEMAAASCAKDPRFHPMEENDLNDFSLEISVLSPLEKIDEPDLIKVGKHGIYLEKNFSRGVLLPQVATEYSWNRETFLQQTCLKAGLPADAWQDPDAEIYIFSAQIITENS